MQFIFVESDTVWCVNNVIEGTTNYVMTFNGVDDSSVIDESTIYKFTCFVSLRVFIPRV